ncbi:WD-40 repeat-containing protein [Lasiosphaeria hispida]|uniref:Mitochondrial division protein 1 n=1 Tax=Lasiosphaeria hispida TaxID=260671 RepID=A0AAJ0HWM4_9PEZI|nr:WD-40 repeat-containing protein [Lasiosphaeria hispida]
MTMVFCHSSQLLTFGYRYRYNIIKIWDAVTGQLRQVLTGLDKYVNSVAMSPDSKQLASASSDGTVRVWRLLD